MKSTAAKSIIPQRMHSKGKNTPKFAIGDFVYSYLNPSERRQIAVIRFSKNPADPPKYQLTLCNDTGKPKRSGWLNERSLSKVKNNIILF